MNPFSFPPRRLFLAFVLSFCALPHATLEARRGEEPEAIVWPEAADHRTLREGLAVRTMVDDELWGGDTRRHQILDTGDGTRTVTLAPIGPGGIERGTELVARVEARAGHRVLFRRSDGELLAFWGGDSMPRAQWIVLRATESGWETRVSEGRSLGPNDPGLELCGARLQWMNGYAVPAAGRTGGWAARFETDASVFFVRCGAGARFRVVSDGACIADVTLEGDPGTGVRVPIELGAPGLRRIEILADRLEFGGVESPDNRTLLAVAPAARPSGRVLWLGEDPIGAGTRSVPWMVGGLLGLDVWNRSWVSAAAIRESADQAQTEILGELGSVPADAVFLGVHPLAEALEGRELATAAGAWFDAVRASVRPATIVLVLPDEAPEGATRREWERRVSTLAKEAKRRGFHFVDWREWGEPERDGSEPTDAAIAGRLAQEFRRLGLDREVQTLAVQRVRESKGVGVGAIAASPPVR